MGFIAPGINLGGPLRADASGGGTGVFINGRDLAARSGGGSGFTDGHTGAVFLPNGGIVSTGD